mgnify:CR=1 FL=1
MKVKGMIIEENIIPEFVEVSFKYLEDNEDDTFKYELFFILGEKKC